MRRPVLFATMATAAFALAACGSSDADADGDGEISFEEAAAKSDEMIKPEPGMYRATTEMIDLQMPGAPPEVREMMQGMMGSASQTYEFCLSQEDTEKGFEEMARETQPGADCSFEKFDVDGGSIDAVMNCRSSERGEVRIAMHGAGTRTSSDMTMTMDASGPEGQSMTIKTRAQQERIGDCDG